MAALALCALALPGCAARSVHSYLERGADLSRYRTYAWAPPDPTSTGDPRLDNNQIFQERVQSAADRELARRGFEKSASSPDLLVHFHARVEQRVDVNEPIEPVEPCDDCSVFIYDEGTLVMDLVDPGTRKVLWRGWSEGNIEGKVDNQRWLEEEVDKTIARIFEQLPRAGR